MIIKWSLGLVKQVSQFKSKLYTKFRQNGRPGQVPGRPDEAISKQD
jgi:hypothetical protein